MTDFAIIPAHLAVKAMRDNGYKNMAYALAELIDNSIQAGATQVEVLLAERYELVTEREKRRIYQVAVIDNGVGMNAEVLRMALQFGNGTRLDANKRDGMGRFGMGLPSASVSQCRRVEVWSWQGDITKANYTYLDLDEIEQRRTSEVPIPKHSSVPTMWLKRTEQVGNSGTLVVWSNIDRATWKTSGSIIKNSELLVGRMYRHFIADKTVKIRMASFHVEADTRGRVNDVYHKDFQYINTFIHPNDPLHLIPYHTLPAPWNREPLFKEFGEPLVIAVEDMHGAEHQVWVRTTIARDEIRADALPGATEYGKHVAKNVGISIVRAGRELDMDEGQVIQHDPVERWWGMEIQFPPALDEVFGVTNNKQAAVILREVLNHKDVSGKDGSVFESEEHEHLLPVLKAVRNTLSKVRRTLAQQTKGHRTSDTVVTPASTQFATTAINTRVNDGSESASDKTLRTTNDAQRVEQNVDVLVRSGTPQPDAVQIAHEIVRQGLRAHITSDFLDSSALFSVRDVGGILHVTLNRNHPAYDVLFVMLDESRANPYPEVERLRRTKIALEMLFFSWARMEDESRYDARLEDQLRRTREAWGTMARDFLATLKER